MIDQEFIEKLKGLIEQYGKNCEDKEECKEKPEADAEGQVVVIEGEGEEMPEGIQDLIDFIRRG